MWMVPCHSCIQLPGIACSRYSLLQVVTPKGGPFPHPTPRALETAELPGIVQNYAHAAANAIAAGFDGVEVSKKQKQQQQ
jgi:2,4-dienoyl-CoA reductase-like NADH-dependent reductase (Old Yellow Enzyme family)